MKSTKVRLFINELFPIWTWLFIATLVAFIYVTFVLIPQSQHESTDITVFVKSKSKVKLVGRNVPKAGTKEHNALLEQIKVAAHTTLGQLDQATPLSLSLVEQLRETNENDWEKMRLAFVFYTRMGYISCRHVSPPLYIIASRLFPEKEVLLYKGKVKDPGKNWEAHTWIEIGEKKFDQRHFETPKEEYQYKWDFKIKIALADDGHPKDIYVELNTDS